MTESNCIQTLEHIENFANHEREWPSEMLEHLGECGHCQKQLQLDVLTEKLAADSIQKKILGGPSETQHLERKILDRLFGVDSSPRKKALL